MSDFALEPLLRALAAAFKARGMHRHVSSLRAFYAGYAKRKRESKESAQQAWSEDDVIEWLRIMRLGPFEHDYPLRHRGDGCPKCNTDAAMGFVVAMWGDGSKMQCHHCGTRWIAQVPGTSGNPPALSNRKPER